MGQYQNLGPIHPGNLTDQNILLTRKEEILLQMHGHKYDMPPESTPTTLETSPSTTGQLLMIPHPNVEPTIRIPRIQLQQNINNP